MATIGAAGLVLYFQYRAIATLESQTQVIVHQISEQAAADIAGELYRALAGPVLDTLTAVSQPDLRAGRFDLVAQQYKKGLEAYPHVDRFLAWSTATEARTPGEALFFGRDGRFDRDPALGRAVFELARRHAPDPAYLRVRRWRGPRQEPASAAARVLDRRAAPRILLRAWHGGGPVDDEEASLRRAAADQARRAAGPARRRHAASAARDRRARRGSSTATPMPERSAAASSSRCCSIPRTKCRRGCPAVSRRSGGRSKWARRS